MFVGFRFLSFPTYPEISVYFNHILYLIVALNTAWLCARVVKSIIEVYLHPLAQKTDSDLDDTLIPILKKLCAFTVYALAFIIILNHFGQEIGPLVAGLGMGGLAFALAAKDLLSNIFGSVTVLLDKPFKISQRVKINGVDGYVQEINIRTTKIKTLDNTMVYVPNAKFTNNVVENISQEPGRKVKMKLGLVYDTSNVKLRKAMKIVNKVLDDQEGLTKERMIYFTEFGDSALVLLVIYFIRDKKNIFSIRHNVNMKIKEAFEKSAIHFAYPTQTLHVRK